MFFSAYTFWLRPSLCLCQVEAVSQRWNCNCLLAPSSLCFLTDSAERSTEDFWLLRTCDRTLEVIFEPLVAESPAVLGTFLHLPAELQVRRKKLIAKPPFWSRILDVREFVNASSLRYQWLPPAKSIVSETRCPNLFQLGSPAFEFSYVVITAGVCVLL